MAPPRFDENGNEIREVNSDISNPTKRQRWATQRLSTTGGVRKRISIMERIQKRSHSHYDKRRSGASSAPMVDSSHEVGGEGSQESSTRKIFFNLPIPESEKDEDGQHRISYPRNKIRTSKYTPLTFVPRNLWLQFHNIANIYFLFIIILGAFPIFGADNPGMNAVPLIAIVVVTAIKDAIEDWRRTVLDSELNNSPVYRLIDWNNVNSTADDVSLWRRFKKACTRATIFVYRSIKHKRKGQDMVDDERRPSFVETPRTSMYAHRVSALADEPGHNGTFQMEPVDPEAHSDWPLSGEDQTVHLHPDKFFNETVKSPSRVAATVLDRSKPSPGTARFKRDYWKSVQVGDFVRIYNGDQIPADIVILSTSDPDGACYVETKNLDGETNLKVRHALHCGRQVKHARDCEKAEFVIDSEPPHPNLYAYNGAIRWEQYDPDSPESPREMVEPISISNLLLRGCSLRNTEWVLGVVVFTGSETKIMLNSGGTPSKRPKLAKDLNWNVIYNFIILFFMCLISGIVNGVAWGSSGRSLDYFDFGSYGSTPAVTGIITFWVAIILFQNLVPISLYITLEIVRTIQAAFIYCDNFMYYERLEMHCVPKSWNISDDVGQIEYIFSDKTGTLTQNLMEFKKCTINGVPYGEAYTEAQLGMQRREGINVEREAARMAEQLSTDKTKMLGMLRKMHNNPYLRDEKLTFIAPDFVADLAGQSGDDQRKAAEHFMLALALCHTVITEHTPGDPPQIEFKAQSPDEAALVATARDCGFTVLGRSGDDIILNVMGQERTYTVLNILEFNSSRKRMSAIIRMPNGSIRLFCKGADSVIYSRLAPGLQRELRKTTAEHLEMFAREGLRTLCIADRALSEKEYEAWSRDHDIAAAAITERDEKLEKVANEIEQQLMLLGGTAIEDRLQDGVPDTISLLADAGIKLWVLTGDKVETAINIGFSCNLLNNNMELIVFNIPESQAEKAALELDRHLQTFGLTGSDEELIAARQDHHPPAGTHAVVIDGDTLKLMLADELKQKFLLLCKQCKSVLCCRVSPAQKAAVVNMVKNGLNIMALAIGDGANDVAMIQEADVGVGIAGEEGRQAAMSSDYAIGQFRFLQRLLLVHGRWCYRRLGESTANFFYKTIVWTFALFWYSIYNDFDGSYLFDYTYIVLVNLAFTSLPVIFMGIFDQDVDDKVSLAVPQLYMRGIERKEWSQWKFWLYMFDGLYQSLMCFFMPYLLFKPANFVTFNGLNVNDRTRMGVVVATSAVLTSNFYIMLNSYRWDWLTMLINVISSLLIFFWTGIYTAAPATASGQFHGAAREIFGTLSFWVVLLLTVVLALLPRFSIKSIQKVFFPQDVDIVREQITQGKFKYLDQFEQYVPPPAANVSSGGSSDSTGSSYLGKPIEPVMKQEGGLAEDERPIYPPSVSLTGQTDNPRSQSSSVTTNYSPSIDRHQSPQSMEYTLDRNRPSFERIPRSLEAGFEPASVAMLTDTAPHPPQSPENPFRMPNERSISPV